MAGELREALGHIAGQLSQLVPSVDAMRMVIQELTSRVAALETDVKHAAAKCTELSTGLEAASRFVGDMRADVKSVASSGSSAHHRIDELKEELDKAKVTGYQQSWDVSKIILTAVVGVASSSITAVVVWYLTKR